MPPLGTVKICCPLLMLCPGRLLTQSSSSLQGETDRRPLSSLAHRVPVLNGPVLAGTHSPMFIPAGLEQHEAGSPLSPRLQPVIILEPSVTHTPLVAGKCQAR